MRCLLLGAFFVVSGLPVALSHAETQANVSHEHFSLTVGKLDNIHARVVCHKMAQAGLMKSKQEKACQQRLARYQSLQVQDRDLISTGSSSGKYEVSYPHSYAVYSAPVVSLHVSPKILRELFIQRSAIQTAAHACLCWASDDSRDHCAVNDTVCFSTSELDKRIERSAELCHARLERNSKLYDFQTAGYDLERLKKDMRANAIIHKKDSGMNQVCFKFTRRNGFIITTRNT